MSITKRFPMMTQFREMPVKIFERQSCQSPANALQVGGNVKHVTQAVTDV